MMPFLRYSMRVQSFSSRSAETGRAEGGGRYRTAESRWDHGKLCGAIGFPCVFFFHCSVDFPRQIHQAERFLEKAFTVFMQNLRREPIGRITRQDEYLM